MEKSIWRLITIAIIVHLPEENKSVAIPSCNNLLELSTHESGSLQKVAFSHVFFQKILGYVELIKRGEIDSKTAASHLEDFAQLYSANILDFDEDENDTISKKVMNIMKEDKFQDDYSVFLRAISGEIFRIFASGALSHAEGDAELGSLPTYMNQHVPTKA